MIRWSFIRSPAGNTTTPVQTVEWTMFFASFTAVAGWTFAKREAAKFVATLTKPSIQTLRISVTNIMLLSVHTRLVAGWWTVVIQRLLIRHSWDLSAKFLYPKGYYSYTTKHRNTPDVLQQNATPYVQYTRFVSLVFSNHKTCPIMLGATSVAMTNTIQTLLVKTLVMLQQISTSSVYGPACLLKGDGPSRPFTTKTKI
jgi:hypothetical protein